LNNNIACIASNNWYEIKRVKGNRPIARYRHTAVAFGTQMVIFGGVDKSQRFNDLNIYDFEQRFW
jgi:hypothetical protein